jgi:hypothetical protein
VEDIAVMPPTNPFPTASFAPDPLHVGFLALLPRVERHGQIYFRHLGPHRKADAIQEMRALAWKWFLRLHQLGKDPAGFVTTFATLLSRAVNSGRQSLKPISLSTACTPFLPLLRLRELAPLSCHDSVEGD